MIKRHHDFPVVVLGGSAGALEPLQQIAGDLPENFPAAVFITTHIPQDTVSAMPRDSSTR